MESWVTEERNWLTKRVIPMRFRFHCAMPGALGIGDHLLRWDDKAIAEAAELVAFYKAIRHIVQHGNLHLLHGRVFTPVDKQALQPLLKKISVGECLTQAADCHLSTSCIKKVSVRRCKL
jgi:alpha-galactosidase